MRLSILLSVILIFSAFLTSAQVRKVSYADSVSDAEQAKEESFAKDFRWVDARKSHPFYQNKVAILIEGQEHNAMTGSFNAVTGYWSDGEWFLSDKQDVTQGSISNFKHKKVKVSYWFPLPCNEVSSSKLTKN